MTDQALASIPKMVADGKKPDEIAFIIGVSESSLRSRCSAAKISLKKPRPSIAIAKRRLLIIIDLETMNYLIPHAIRLNVTLDTLAKRLIETIARDNLYNAVIDDKDNVA